MKKHPHPGVIELKLRDVNQLFNSMDPSPFLQKDLDADAEEFIVSWARELHAHRRLRLVVHLENFAGRPAACEVITEAVHHFFAERALMKSREVRQTLRIGRTSLLIGLAFLVSFLFGAHLVEQLGESPMIRIAREGLIIGGWVAMWRPLELLLYAWWPLAQEARLLRRLAQMEVEVKPAVAAPPEQR